MTFLDLLTVAGDVVLREKPYAAVLEAIFRVNHCAYCLKKTPTPIPCFECSTVSCLMPFIKRKLLIRNLASLILPKTGLFD